MSLTEILRNVENDQFYVVHTFTTIKVRRTHKAIESWCGPVYIWTNSYLIYRLSKQNSNIRIQQQKRPSPVLRFSSTLTAPMPSSLPVIGTLR